MTDEENQDARRLATVLGHLASGDRLAALGALRPLIGVTCRTHPIVPMPVLPRESRPTGTGAETKSPPVAIIASVYARDGFICRYCGRWTIPNQPLRLISTAFPDDFTWHPNWRMDVTPRAYWDISTSVDHIRAVSTGGDWQDLANLATACARCQYQKSNLPLEALGWELRPSMREPAWDGCVRRYRELWEALGCPDERVHAPWVKAFAAAIG